LGRAARGSEEIDDREVKEVSFVSFLFILLLLMPLSVCRKFVPMRSNIGVAFERGDMATLKEQAWRALLLVGEVVILRVGIRIIERAVSNFMVHDS
jgi:hypothetical protein